MEGEQILSGGPGGISITLAPGAEEAGLASMQAEMIKTNLENKPERVKDFKKLKGTVWITADDADVQMTMKFDNGSLVVHKGLVGTPMLEITTDASTLMDLANVSIRYGMPWYFDDVGKMVIKKLWKKELKIKGMFVHNMTLTHLTKVMSVK